MTDPLDDFITLYSITVSTTRQGSRRSSPRHSNLFRIGRSSTALRMQCDSAGRQTGTLATLFSLNLRKYDDRPFIVCLVTPTRNYCLISNSTFLKKISHSSQELRKNNIRGSFNGSDIVKDFEGIENSARNIWRLYAIHAQVGFDGNLERLVEATNNISPSGSKFSVVQEAEAAILAAPRRAI